ncbi:MAG: thermonuclease family protein [Pseudomonadota bacterium]
MASSKPGNDPLPAAALPADAPGGADDPACDAEPGAAANPVLATETLKAVEHIQLSPLSIQAASLVRSVDALSRIFWISLAGTFLTIFFAGLAQLEVNASSEFISLGEYQVPKNLVPLVALLFALFVFWLTANRLRMLCYVLSSSSLPETMVDEIFRLNPPVLNVFDEDNDQDWSPFNGVGVLIINWAVFMGNAIALTLFSTFQRGAVTAEFDFLELSLYLLAAAVVLIYGVRAVFPPLRTILTRLHGLTFRIGWQRKFAGVLLILATIAVQNLDKFADPAEQADDLLGPAFANAIDGETLFMRGIEVKLFGIDAVERDQVCQNQAGEDYPCGSVATQALQQRVHNQDVVCWPLYAISATKVLGMCAVQDPGGAMPGSPDEFREIFAGDSLSRIQVELGHALSVGVGEEIYADEQNQAQMLRLGIWQGSFEPPAAWRARGS